MRRLILIITMLLPLSIYAQSWTFGVDAGISINQFSASNGSSMNPSLVKSGEPHPGLNAGANANYTSKKGFVYGTGLSYKSNKEGSFHMSGSSSHAFVSYSGIEYVNFEYGSIELPINFGYKINVSEKFAITPMVGVWGAINVGGDMAVYVMGEPGNTNDIYNSNNPFEDMTYSYGGRDYNFSSFSRFDVGLMAGVEFSLSKFYFKFGANFGLINARNDLDSSFKHNSYSFLLGYKF